nr:major capsid protein [uncultured Roseococcus sp.]
MSGSMNSMTVDVFRSDPFSAVTLTNAVERVPFKPGLLGSIGLFTPMAPLYTKDVLIEVRDGVLRVIPTSQRGAPIPQRSTERRRAYTLEAPRVAFGDTIYAHEIQFVRSMGEAGLIQLQAEVARRMAGPTGLMSSLDLTLERHRLGCIQGRVLDADNSEIVDFYEVFGIAEPDEMEFDFTGEGKDGLLQKQCNAVSRAILRAAKAPDGVGGVMALCGDEFWDALTTCAEVRETYIYQTQAAELRQRTAFETFDFGRITWVNYRGTDDNDSVTGVAIGSTKVRFFPTGVPGLFEEGFTPGEFLTEVGQPGKSRYIQTEFDPASPPSWWKQNLLSYPVYICTRPETLQRGKLA